MFFPPIRQLFPSISRLSILVLLASLDTLDRPLRPPPAPLPPPLEVHHGLEALRPRQGPRPQPDAAPPVPGGAARLEGQRPGVAARSSSSPAAGQVDSPVVLAAVDGEGALD